MPATLPNSTTIAARNIAIITPMERLSTSLVSCRHLVLRPPAIRLFTVQGWDERFHAGELDDLLVKAIVIVNFNGGL
jgi:hypothetical protein